MSKDQSKPDYNKIAEEISDLSTPLKLKLFLMQPIRFHYHELRPEACLTLVEKAVLERAHTQALSYIQKLEEREGALHAALHAVMHSVDKWLDVKPYDFDKDDGTVAASRAADAREVALKAIEKAESALREAEKDKAVLMARATWAELCATCEYERPCFNEQCYGDQGELCEDCKCHQCKSGNQWSRSDDYYRCAASAGAIPVLPAQLWQSAAKALKIQLDQAQAEKLALEQALAQVRSCKVCAYNCKECDPDGCEEQQDFYNKCRGNRKAMWRWDNPAKTKGERKND